MVCVRGATITVRDCTRADLEHLHRRHLRGLAPDVEPKLTWFERLIALLDEHGVTTVGELPEQGPWEPAAPPGQLPHRVATAHPRARGPAPVRRATVARRDANLTGTAERLAARH
jgi:hypothetical protein